MEDNSYKNFMDMEPSKQISFVQEQKQGEPKPFPDVTKKFPDLDFIELVGQQDKKPIKLATYRYPVEKPKGIVVFFHSICLHMGITINIAEELAKNGFMFVGYDQRGHGRSEGQKGYLDDTEGLLSDAYNFLTKIQEYYSGVPLFLMGHGVGSLIAIIAFKEIKKVKISGLIIGAPLLAQPQSNKFLATVSEVALKLIPNKTGIFATDPLKASKNPNVSDYIKTDPLIYRQKIYANTLMQMVKFRNMNAPDDWNKLETPPFVLIQGQIDKIADPIIGLKFFQAIKTQDKECWWYEKMWNNYILEEESVEITHRLVKWLDKHI